MVGVFNHIRVFSCISLMTLFSFVVPSAAMQGQTKFDAASGAELLGAVDSVAFLTKEPAKRRKEPLFRVPADRPIKPVLDQETSLVLNVSVPDMFSYAVVQQPEDNPYYVSSERDLVTEFGLAKKYGNVGLIAHNDRAGYIFSDLTVGQEIHVQYKDGHTDRYTVSAIHRFRALEPTKTESQFVDLESEKVFTANEVFEQMYTGEPHVTLQTCIYADGDQSWGRLFVIALPVIEVE